MYTSTHGSSQEIMICLPEHWFPDSLNVQTSKTETVSFLE